MSNEDSARSFLRGLRILLVEDDPLICLDLESSLAEFGAIVTAVNSVPKALKAMATVALDFAVLDFEIGSQTSEPIATVAKVHKVPFLYLSGYSEHDARFSNWPGVQVLAKPLSADAIARGIQAELSKIR
jgi:two-component SAPR family response regulator